MKEDKKWLLNNNKVNGHCKNTRTVRFCSGRRRKCITQAVFGLFLGLMLGYLMNSDVFVSLQVNNNGEKCTQPPKYSDKVKKTETSINPLSIINLEDATINTHNTQQTLVFVGVMTAQKYVSTRAVAVYDTWGKELPGRIAFFSSQSSTVPPNRTDLPLVRLYNVDDSYPPQKKSFMMLQYMWQHYGNKFEWFIRADDDVYIRPDKLEHLLRSIDSRKAHFIGQAGRGNQEEFGLLSLEYDENFCMGGPGVIMSRETLSRVAPHIKYCLKNLYTTHEDVELGRCVRKFANVSCTWSYEMQTILYHNSSGQSAFTGSLKQKEVQRAITLHPVKQHHLMYRIHQYMKGLKIQDLQQKMILLHRDIKKLANLIFPTTAAQDIFLDAQTPLFPDRPGDPHYLGDSNLLGSEPSLNKYQYKMEEDIITWDFIQRSIYSSKNFNPRRRIELPYREGLTDIVREVMDMINQFSKQRGRVIEYQDLFYGYVRLNPIHGPEYILDLLLKYKKYRGRKMTVPVRRHAYLQQQFIGLEIQEVPIKESSKTEETLDILENSLINLETNKKQSETITFIVPLSGRKDSFDKFITNFEEICLKTNENVALIIVLFKNKQQNTIHYTINKIHHLKILYPTKKLQLIPVYEEFQRAKALQIGFNATNNDINNILFFIDIDIQFDSSTLNRIRLNTVYNKQVYFPIVFSQYDPNIVYSELQVTDSPNHFLINSKTGYWRQFGFGILSVYKNDLISIGGFDTSIEGWGKEDVDLFDKFVGSNITIFRSVDPTLIHRFHIVDCDPNLDVTQLKMCKGTRMETYGSVQQLTALIYNHYREQIFNFVKTRRKKS